MLVPYFKASWDNTQVLRTNDQDKSSETPFFIKPKNSAFQVNSIVNTLIWAVGDGKDGVNDQEFIVKILNDALATLRSVQTVKRPVLLRGNDGELYWVTGAQAQFKLDVGLDGAAMMESADQEEARCSINSEYRCDRC